MIGDIANTALIAMTEPGLDGLQAPWPYSPLIALGLFVGIPVAVFAIVILAVYGASWTRSGRTSGDYSTQPAWLSSPRASMTAPAGPGTQLPAGPSDPDAHGGTSARW